MKIIIEISNDFIPRIEDSIRVRAMQRNGAPLGMPAQFEQYVYNPRQVNRAVDWMKDDVIRNYPEVQGFIVRKL
tara:strand:+ start:719 stop:940 length:222 start_codon:yes stop_codon:yes gene_type:complete